jgi:hypothetical protein
VSRLRVALLFALVACAPTYHSAPRYRYNAPAADALEAEAAASCPPHPDGGPTRPFVTDGCSLWPDGLFSSASWQRCCVKHDIAYWCGGTQQQREDADRELAACVRDEYAGWMAGLMWAGVRVGGHWSVPFYWRWGYGREYPSRYTD